MSHYSLSGKRIWVAGHRGMVGGAARRRLESENCDILTVTRDEVDLTSKSATKAWIAANKPDAIIIAAAHVGGIHANSARPVEFLRDNLAIALNIIDSAHQADVDRLMFLGSACIYPRSAPQPIPESALLTGPLEPTNEWYALSKIAGVKLCQAYRRQYGRDYISAMPNNLYGPGDNFDPMLSHVIPGMMSRFHGAKISGADKVTVWGTGRPRREFMYVEDLADALVHLLRCYSETEHVNVGSGEEVSIGELARLMRGAVGFEGGIDFDATKPDGMPRKFVDAGRLSATGWAPATFLREGLAKTYDWFLENAEAGKSV